MKDSAKQKILDNEYENVVVFSNDEYDTALIGISHDNRAVYDYDKMVKWLIDHDGMTEDEAIEWIEYNTIRALPYVPGSPIIVYSFFD